MQIAKRALLSMIKIMYFRYQATASSGFAFLTNNYPSENFSSLNRFYVLFN